MGRRQLISLLALLLCTPAFATWHEASTEKFLVYSDGSESGLVEFTQEVDRFDAYEPHGGAAAKWALARLMSIEPGDARTESGSKAEDPQNTARKDSPRQ